MVEIYDKMTWPTATSTDRPTAACLSTGQPAIAWRGDHNSRNITVGVVDSPTGESHKGTLIGQPLADTSDFAPAVLYYENVFWMAWTGTNGGHTLCTAVNAARILTPFRRLKFDPRWLVDLQSSLVLAAGTRPRSRSLSR